MRLNRFTQYALLFVLYLAKQSTPVTAEEAAKALGISKSFLEQIARRLKAERLTHSMKGPGGGHVLIGSPTVEDVLNAAGCEFLLSAAEFSAYYDSAGAEHRALAGFVTNFYGAIKLLLKRQVRSLHQEVLVNDYAMLSKAKTIGGMS